MVDLPFHIEFGDFRVVVEEGHLKYRWSVLSSSSGDCFKSGFSDSVEEAIAEAFTFLDLENY